MHHLRNIVEENGAVAVPLWSLTVIVRQPLTNNRHTEKQGCSLIEEQSHFRSPPGAGRKQQRPRGVADFVALGYPLFGGVSSVGVFSSSDLLTRSRRSERLATVKRPRRLPVEELNDGCVSTLQWGRRE